MASNVTDIERMREIARLLTEDDGNHRLTPADSQELCDLLIRAASEIETLRAVSIPSLQRNAIFTFANARVGTGSRATDADILNWVDEHYPIAGEWSAREWCGSCGGDCVKRVEHAYD
jgi:hypothetical protein